MADDLDRLPVVVSRDVLWSWETAVSYKDAYRQMMDARLAATVRAVSARDRSAFLDWAQSNDVAFVLLPADWLTPTTSPRWLKLITGDPATKDAWSARAGGWLAQQGECRTGDKHTIIYSVSCLAADNG